MLSTINKVFAGLIVSVLFLGSPGVAGAGERYQIDPAHSFIEFRISHLGVSILKGRFNEIAGAFVVDPANPQEVSVQVTVQTASIDSNHAKRDRHLRGEDFLDVEQFPTATFVSSGYQGDADSGVLTGRLTLHGVTREVSIPVTRVGAGEDPWGGYRRGYQGTLTIVRDDYDISYNLGPAAQKVYLELFLEGIRQ